jgi:hypothetical protein
LLTAQYARYEFKNQSLCARRLKTSPSSPPIPYPDGCCPASTGPFKKERKRAIDLCADQQVAARSRQAFFPCGGRRVRNKFWRYGDIGLSIASGNFHADCRRWLDLFSDEQIIAMKNDPLDGSSVEAEIEIGKMS